MKHHLDPLLKPRSVAVVGASARTDSMGEWSLKNLLRGGFDGRIYPVNPGHQQLQGIRCYGSVAELPEVPDLVIFAVADHRIEDALTESIAKQIPAAVIMSSLYLDDDQTPQLKARVQQKVDAAGMLVCGANGMGFYNFRDNVWACGFDSRLHSVDGHVSLISHSGSGMSGIIDCEARLRVNVAVSTGNEISVTMDQYLDFVLDLTETKVVGLFIETARNPTGFRAALQKANDRRIPVVALKVGRTARSAELAVSHSGAMAGDDATYAALFDRYGVHRVRDMDELATTLILFAECGPLGSGGLVTLHDSGGERQLMVDLAAEADVAMTELGSETATALKNHLDPELPAVNPLDAWSRGGVSAGQQMTDCLATMLLDEGAAIGAVIHDRAPDGVIYESYVRYMEHAYKVSGKPVALVAARQGTGGDPLVVSTTHRGYPVLDGVTPFLNGVRAMMNYRDFLARPAMHQQSVAAEVTQKWSTRLRGQVALDEFESLKMLREFGVHTSDCQVAESAAEVLSAANDIGYPVALKTAMPGALHKTEQNGVVLNLGHERALIAAYSNMSRRLGARVLLAGMVRPGVEMILGARNDPQFGAVVVLGFGGMFAEVLQDIAFALPPFDAGYARSLLDKLVLRPLLHGVRGTDPVDVDEFCSMAARFSTMVAALEPDIQEIDVNPLIVNPFGCTVVDALVVGKTTSKDQSK